MSLCCDRVLTKTRGFLVETEYFLVATDFGQDKKGFMSRQSILCRDRVWPIPRGLGLRQNNLCRDRA